MDELIFKDFLKKRSCFVQGLHIQGLKNSQILSQGFMCVLADKYLYGILQ